MPYILTSQIALLQSRAAGIKCKGESEHHLAQMSDSVPTLTPEQNFQPDLKLVRHCALGPQTDLCLQKCTSLRQSTYEIDYTYPQL